MAGVKRYRSRVKNNFFTKHSLTRIAIFLLIVTGTLSLPKPFDDGTPIVHPQNKKTGPVDPNNFEWDQILKFIMKSQGSPEPSFLKDYTDSVEDYNYQSVPKAFTSTTKDKINDDSSDNTINGMDVWTSSKENDGTGLVSASMHASKIINETLLMKLKNATATDGYWSVCQLPIIVTVTGVLTVVIITLIVVLWFKRQMLKGYNEGDIDEVSDSFEENLTEDQSMTGNSPSNPAQGPQQPAPSQPEIELKDYAGVVTHEAERARHQEKVAESVTESGKEEVEQKPEEMVEDKSEGKFKGGLLERRGSFANLTFDLPQGVVFDSRLTFITPPEDNTDEYLLTTTKVLTPPQIAAVLEDIQALHAEFWDIPLNHPEKIEVSMSGTKNRYETIMPNDRTRVDLGIASPYPLDSYINANYIRGFEGEEKAYIATQGPLDNTIVDFYHMIWKEKSPVIVMITKLLEKNKRKCETYFPLDEGQTIKFGEYDITTLSITPKDGYTVRELVVQKYNVSRLVLHYWLDSWADHQIPDDANTILTMSDEVEKLRLALKNSAYPFDAEKYQMGFAPITVHCSAGIGRTGCFIGITIGMNQLKKDNKVDILGIVCQMRYDRGGMVQTGEQYEFVHKALLEFAQTLPGNGRN